MAKRWIVSCLAVLLAVPVLWVFVSLTATPIHSNAESVPTVAGAAPPARTAAAVAKARQAVLAHVVGRNLPGVSVAAGVDGELVWAEGFGYADLKSGTVVTPAHRFRVASASEVLTSAAAGLLLEEGRLGLEDEIQTFLPTMVPQSSPMRVRDLMGHTSGVVSNGGTGGPLFAHHCNQPEEAVPYFSRDALLFAPGAEFRYSDGDWILMSAAIAFLRTESFVRTMRERVFVPAGMRDTVPDPMAGVEDDDFPLANLVRELIYDPRARRDATPDPRWKPAPELATPYATRFGSDPRYGVHVMRPLDYSCYAGAGMYVSTPSDLVRFGLAVNGGKLLRPETVKRLQTSRKLASGAETGYGFGWYSRTVTLPGGQTVRVTGQDGESMGGMVASLLTIPEDGVVVAVMANVPFSDTYALAVKVAEAFAGAAI